MCVCMFGKQYVVKSSIGVVARPDREIRKERIGLIIMYRRGGSGIFFYSEVCGGIEVYIDGTEEEENFAAVLIERWLDCWYGYPRVGRKGRTRIE